MDRYKFCYGKKRGLKAENDQRWLDIYNEQQNANLIFSDDDGGDDDKTPKEENKGSYAVRKTTKNNQATKMPTHDLSDSQSESNTSSELLPSRSINEGKQEVFCMDGLKKALNKQEDDDDAKVHGDDNDDQLDDDDDEGDCCKKECSDEEEINFLNKEDDDDDDCNTSRDQRADDTTAYWADDDENLSGDDCSYESCYLQTSPSYHEAEESGRHFLSTCDYGDGDDDYSHDATTFHDAHVITSDDDISDAAKEINVARSEYPDNDCESDEDDNVHESDDDDNVHESDDGGGGNEEDFSDEIGTSEIYRGEKMHHETFVDDNDCHHIDDDQQFVSCHDNSNVTDNEATMLTRKNGDDDDDDDGGSEHEDGKEVTVVCDDDDFTKDDDDDDFTKDRDDDDTPEHGDEMERTLENLDDNNDDCSIKEKINIDDGDDDDQEEEKNTTTCSLSIKETSFKRDRRLTRNSLLSSWAVSICHDDDVGHDDDDAIEKAIALLNELWEVNTKVTSKSSRLSGRGQEDDMETLSKSMQQINITKSCNTYDEILKFSDQKKPLNFANVFTKKWIKNCKKIGEGSYAEVFEVIKNDDVMAIKVVPVRSDDDNDCDQQSFREILFEMTISRELAKLRGQTDCFVDLKKVWFMSGKYPKILMDAWDEYDEEKTSENDRPDFSKDQHFVVLGFEMGGVPLETFELTDHRQLISIIKQVSASLSIAETRLSFEHRDLHLGNILIRKVPDNSTVSFVHFGKKLEFPSHGLKVTLIDYTLSRMTKNGCIFFKDLSTDESLFEGQGDTQYDVYRDMRIVTGNTWSVFKPSTNILWLKHMVDKIHSLARQLQKVSDSMFVREVIDLSDRLLAELNECGCAWDFVFKSFVFKY